MPPPDRPVLIVSAMREELQPVLKRLSPRAEGRLEGHTIFRAIAGLATDLVLSATGDGSARAGRYVSRLCETYGPSALIGIGAAGALTESLAPLDVVASARLKNGLAEVPTADGILLSLATAAGAVAGTLVTTSAPAVTREAKKILARDAGDVAAVDMESAAWARAAAANGVPFVIVRAILDSADEELPSYLPECVGPGGGISRAAVLAHALARPWTLPALIRMRRALAACGEELARFLMDEFFGVFEK